MEMKIREPGDPMYIVKLEDKFLHGDTQITREEAQQFFGKEQFESCMQDAKDRGYVVAFVGVRNNLGEIVNAYVSKVPNDGKKRPLRYESP